MNVLASVSYRPFQGWRIGALPLSPHGIATLAGYLAGMWLMARAAQRRGLSRQAAYDISSWAFIGALIGMRAFYVAAHRSQFSSLRDVLAIWNGGLTLFGGIVGGMVAATIYVHRHRLDLAGYAEAAAPGLVAGIAIGRIGDLIIGDHLGRPTGFFLGYRIPPGADLAPGFGPPVYVTGAVVHLTALYDLAGVALLAVALWLLARSNPRPPALWPLTLAWYGAQRFALDFTRYRGLIESDYFGLSGSQIAGLVFIALGAAWFYSGRRRYSDSPRPSGSETRPAS